MNPTDRPALEQEIGHLVKDDRPDRAAEFSACIRRTVRAWDARLTLDARATRWELLEAYLARTDCDEDYSSPLHAERLGFCHQVYRRLVAEDGLEYVVADLRRLQTARRLAAGEIELHALSAQVSAVPKAEAA